VAEVARYGDADIVVTGIVGCAGLLPTIAAIEAGKILLLPIKKPDAGGPVVLPLIENMASSCYRLTRSILPFPNAFKAYPKADCGEFC
jgi:hypothetical protein